MEGSDDESDTDSWTSVEENDISEEEDVTSIKEHYTQYTETLNTTDDNTTFVEYLEQNVTRDDIARMSELKQGSKQWHKAREGRITASNAGAVLSLKDTDKSLSLTKSILNPSSFISVYTEHGKFFEGIARDTYLVQQASKHKSLEVSACGIFVDSSAPFLGASPDGLVDCVCHEQRLLEIKCPYKFRYTKPMDIPKEDPKYHLYLENDELQIKTTSPWYNQIIFQMGVLDVHLCHLVIYTLVEKDNCKIIPIKFDNDRWEMLKEKSQKIFEECIIPNLDMMLVENDEEFVN